MIRALTKAVIDDDAINLNYPGTTVDVPLRILLDFMVFKARIIFDDGLRSLSVMAACKAMAAHVDTYISRRIVVTCFFRENGVHYEKY